MKIIIPYQMFHCLKIAKNWKTFGKFIILCAYIFIDKGEFKIMNT